MSNHNPLARGQEKGNIEKGRDVDRGLLTLNAPGTKGGSPELSSYENCQVEYPVPLLPFLFLPAWDFLENMI